MPPRSPASPPPTATGRAPEVRVLAEDRTPLGVMPTRQALAEARALGVDMILVGAVLRCAVL